MTSISGKADVTASIEPSFELLSTTMIRDAEAARRLARQPSKASPLLKLTTTASTSLGGIPVSSLTARAGFDSRSELGDELRCRLFPFGEELDSRQPERGVVEHRVRRPLGGTRRIEFLGRDCLDALRVLAGSGENGA